LGSGVDVNVGEATGVSDGVAVSMGVDVAVKTGVSEGVIDVAVGDPTGVADVGVSEAAGVSEVAVGEAAGVNEVGVSDAAGVSDVAVGEASGVNDVAVGETTGVAVSEPTAVGVNVAVGPLPVTVSVVPTHSISVRMLSPFETRAVHSTVVCPATRPVTLKLKTSPLVVALLPLLPAMAKIKLPTPSFTATTGSSPNSDVATGSPTLTRPAL
jgi:hypothetical protein